MVCYNQSPVHLLGQRIVEVSVCKYQSDVKNSRRTLALDLMRFARFLVRLMEQKARIHTNIDLASKEDNLWIKPLFLIKSRYSQTIQTIE